MCVRVRIRVGLRKETTTRVMVNPGYSKYSYSISALSLLSTAEGLKRI